MHKQPSWDLIYVQATGSLVLCDESDSRCLLARCYSGIGPCRDNPECEGRVNAGPIPRGLWRVGDPVDSQRTGPFVLPLHPIEVPSLRTSGRDGFQIHGDNRAADFTASRGCIIAPRRIRGLIASLGIRSLLVK